MTKLGLKKHQCRVSEDQLFNILKNKIGIEEENMSDVHERYEYLQRVLEYDYKTLSDDEINEDNDFQERLGEVLRLKELIDSYEDYFRRKDV